MLGQTDNSQQAAELRKAAEADSIARANLDPTVKVYGPDNIPPNLLKAYPELAKQAQSVSQKAQLAEQTKAKAPSKPAKSRKRRLKVKTE